MYIHFTFWHKGNPYITKTNEALFKMVLKYDLVQLGADEFFVAGERQYNGNAYVKREVKKEVLRAFAIDWQSNFERENYSWGELAEWQGFFEEYGRKYGLLREFKENGIC